MWNDVRKDKLHNMHISCIKVVAQFQSHLAADIATTRPRNSTLGKFLLLSSIIIMNLLKLLPSFFPYLPQKAALPRALLDQTRAPRKV